MKKIIIILVGILGIIAIYNLWGYIGYARAIRKDAQRLFASHKNFFKSFEFSGAVAEKKYCEKCQLNKYQIIIDLRVKNPEAIEFGNLSYPPYYMFNDKNQLTVSVTRQIYYSAVEDSLIKKEMNSDSLVVQDSKYRLLSDKEMVWLAEPE